MWEIAANVGIIFSVFIIVIMMLFLLLIVSDLIVDVITGRGFVDKLIEKRKRKKHIQVFKKLFKEGDKVKINPNIIREWYPKFLYINENKILKINKIYYDKKESMGMVKLLSASGKYSYKVDIYDAQDVFIKHNPMEVFEFDENLFKI